jgi:hypothetical protein
LDKKKERAKFPQNSYFSFGIFEDFYNDISSDNEKTVKVYQNNQNILEKPLIKHQNNKKTLTIISSATYTLESKTVCVALILYLSKQRVFINDGVTKLIEKYTNTPEGKNQKPLVKIGIIPNLSGLNKPAKKIAP